MNSRKTVKRTRRRDAPSTDQAVEPTQRRRQAPEPEWVGIGDIVPYEFNPRDNTKAIQSVANSLEQFGWMQPVVIDGNNEIVAGHTRVEAAKLLGDEEVLCWRAEHLTPDQIRAFRVVDNKLAELADWDQTMLSHEMQALMGVVDFTDFGWTQEAVDCLGEIVDDDCLSGGAVTDALRGDAPSRTNNGEGPQRTRIIIGEFVMYVDIDNYRVWAAGVKEDNNFVQDDIIADLKRRLGVHEFEGED